MNEHQLLAIHALTNMRGDDHLRAQITFRNYSEADMQEEYGRSGKTCAEILAGYQERVAKVDAAIEWVRGAA